MREYDLSIIKIMESSSHYADFDYISMEALLKMDSSKYLLVDVRPSANYRGWPE
jgi:hypothetical protein